MRQTNKSIFCVQNSLYLNPCAQKVINKYIYTYIRTHITCSVMLKTPERYKYEGWNFNSGNYLFTTDTK